MVPSTHSPRQGDLNSASVPPPFRQENQPDDYPMIDALFDAFVARRAMQHVFAQLRGDDDAESLG
jgi:hypothetical protein